MAEPVSISEIFGGNEPEKDFVIDMHCQRCGKDYKLYFHCTESIFKIASRIKNAPFCDECETEREEAEVRRKMAIYARDNAIKAGAPEEFLEWDRQQGNVPLMNFIWKNRKKSLFLIDEPDTNKTRCLSAIVKKLFEFDYSRRIQFFNFNDMATKYLALSSRSYEAADSFKRSISSLDLLIIDDFGKKRITEAVGDMLYYVFNRIYERNALVWISANKASGILQTRFEHEETGEVIFSRFNRMVNSGNMVFWDHGKTGGLENGN